MAFDYYITKNNKRLRLGFTTGTCAALAAKACCYMLISGTHVQTVQVDTPKGIPVETEIYDILLSENECECAVIKDGGDDIDATDGMKIYAKVCKTAGGITIDGGTGIGRVTKRGLDQPVGAAAINSIPRLMIEQAAESVIKETGYSGGFYIEIYAPEGVEIAKRTFNANLGIVGGISIIGSSGIVEPQSLQAITDTIKTEIRVLGEEGHDKLIVTPGNYGESYVKELKNIDHIPYVKCANFIGDTIEYAKEFGFKKVLFVGHAGKFVKLAGGMMNTHSAFGDCRMEILAAHTACFEAKLAPRILDCVTVDEAVELLDEFGLRQRVMERIGARIEMHLARKGLPEVETGVIFFTNQHGLLAVGTRGEKLINDFGGQKDER